MSSLSTAVVQDKKGNVISMKVLQSHPDGGVSTEGMSENAIKGTALLFLYELALEKEASALTDALEDTFGGSPDIFPDSEECDKVIKTLTILEESRNNNWDNWSSGPYSNGSSLKEEYMPYVLLQIEVADPGLLVGLEVDDDVESAIDFFAYKWM